MDGIKAHQKLVSLGEHMVGEYPTGMDNDQLELCRYLYKLHFQLLMFLESFSKLLRLVSQSHTDLTSDKSTEVSLIQNELRKVFKMSPVELEAALQRKAEQLQSARAAQSGDESVTSQPLMQESTANIGTP